MQIVESLAPVPAPSREIETTLPLPPRLLAALAIDYDAYARFDVLGEPAPGERTSARVHRTATHDIWIIRWGIGSRTVLHDHGGSAGALYVASGALVEHRPNPVGIGRPLRRSLRALDHRAMSASHVHEIVNESAGVAESIHVYSPPLETMHHYELDSDSQLQIIRREAINDDLPSRG